MDGITVWILAFFALVGLAGGIAMIPGLVVGGLIPHSRKRVIFGIIVGVLALGLYFGAKIYPIELGALAWFVPVLAGLSCITVAKRLWAGLILAVLFALPSGWAVYVMKQNSKDASNSKAITVHSPWAERTITLRLGNDEFEYPFASLTVQPTVYAILNEFRAGSEGKFRALWKLSRQGRKPVDVDSLILRLQPRHCARPDRPVSVSFNLCKDNVTDAGVWCGTCDQTQESSAYFLRKKTASSRVVNLRRDDWLDVPEGEGIDWFGKTGVILQVRPSELEKNGTFIWRKFYAVLPGGTLSGTLKGDAGHMRMTCNRIGHDSPYEVSCEDINIPLSSNLILRPTHRVRFTDESGLEPLQKTINEGRSLAEAVLGRTFD